ncbi:unnamed protein product [Chilo suppressalis]|uniref:Daxx histone-binding domain-containing protein n=1 Tax=Chilo suppressalis TaxID=168631 RepID=A0ABN8B8C4_CHISP|nr:unnamed protein product [Chilo suppressalis]
MASEDVIELGSSDDEAEPATKKIKPMPNAMVHIPNKIHGVTIKPTRPNPVATPKVLSGKNITVTKINSKNIVSNPYAANKLNGKTLKRPTSSFIQPTKQLVQVKPSVNPMIPIRPVSHALIQNRQLNKSLIQNKPSVNPLHIIKKINSQVVINKVASGSRSLKTPIKINSPKTINNLPPSITVTRTSGSMKRAGTNVNINTLRKKHKINEVVKPVVNEVLTVDLDDDESSSSTASPQWYLKPEEQSTVSAEEINNKEPEKPLYVEITIEDSPVKPPNKKTCEIGAELAVTIDDSPIKTVTNKNADHGSDTEDNPITKDKHSKKKLEYPQEDESVSKTIEIEISPCMQNVMNAESDIKKNEIIDTIIEIEESPLKVQGQGTSTPKKDHKRSNFSTVIPVLELREDDELSEFHPVYQNFIKLCFQLENSDDMKKIVEKKIKTYYRQVPKNYTESEEFIDMVSSKIVAMKAGPEKMYLYIKDIVDELNLQRKMAKSQVLSDIAAKNSDSDKFVFGEDSEYDSKRQRQIRKLEKTLKKLHRAIQKLEEQEVDFDDDEDSVYLLTESDEGCTSNKDSDKQLVKDPKTLLLRYKERMVRVHAKFCQLTNTKMPSEPRVQIDARPGQPQGPAKKLEKWINKKVPIGTPLPFPDFHDVLRCVREANEEDKLGWNEADVMEEARDLFTRCGKKLQRRRQENEWRMAASRITVDADPAEKSEDLKMKLTENKKVAAKRETEILNKYADRQSQLKLEAEEIGDKEAEESPVESDDDDNIDESSLQNKEKRKERLKRLIQEKSKKTPEVISGPTNESSNERTEKHNVEKDNEDEKNSTVISAENITEESSLAANKENDQTSVQEDKSEANKENQLNPKAQVIENNKLDDINPNNNSDTIDKVVNSNRVCDKPKNDDNEKIHSLSDDSNKVESDIDELHLLQKLHSGNEINYSTSDISGCDTPIAISDTLESSEDSKKQVGGVISIENSSYSESEDKDPVDDNDDNQENILEKNKESLPFTDEEMERSTSANEKKVVTTNNDEYNESIEDILLASTDDEAEVNNDAVKTVNEQECVNLKDDTISIGDTVVEEVKGSSGTNTLTKHEDANSIESMTLVSTNALESQEDASSIESVTLAATKASEKEDDAKSTESVTMVSTNQLEMEDDAKSIDSVTLVSPKVLEKEEDVRSIESVTLVATNASEKEDDAKSTESVTMVSTNQLQKEDDAKSIDSVTLVSPKALEKEEDVRSIESVTLVSTGEVSVELDKNELQNAMENNSTEKQNDIPFIESSDMLLNINNVNAAELSKENVDIHKLSDNTERKDNNETPNFLKINDIEE